jgi:hypothetical protein
MKELFETLGVSVVIHAVALVAAFLLAYGFMFAVKAVLPDERDSYIAACESSGGKPVSNGRFMECLK